MSDQILEFLKDGHLSSTAVLADKLSTTPEMIEAKLERLAMLGYVKKIVLTSKGESSCGSCTGCPKGKKETFVFWELGDREF